MRVVWKGGTWGERSKLSVGWRCGNEVYGERRHENVSMEGLVSRKSKKVGVNS